MDLEKLFADIFDVPRPYGQFQIEPARHLLAGRDVILQAPTGSGKTKAALFPFLLARKEGLDFPRKLLYAVPMRVLARSFREDLEKDGRHSDLDARLQTGEQQDDRRLEGEVIFATIDQVLSSFLNIPYSLSLRQGNLNAGAVASSYLVLDEFHLLDPKSTLPTTLEMLRILRGVTPFLLMTATFSAKMLQRLAGLLDAQVVTVPSEELPKIPTQRGKERRFHRVNGLLTAEAILTYHRTRSIAICNTVDRAQQLADDLQKALEERGDTKTQVILLHARFLRAHRRQKEEDVRRLFGKGGDKGDSVILVATQVIEVGLDITCEALHTEVAPASSILQRAGRCARFAEEKGNVYIYQVPPNRQGDPNFAPYLAAQATLCKSTWEGLGQQEFDGKCVDFATEQCLVNLVHAKADGDMLNGLAQTSYAHRQEMGRAIGRQEVGSARSLIRSDDSVTLFVHPRPQEIARPYELEGFSLYFGTLVAQFKEWWEAGVLDETWTLMYPEEVESAEEDRPSRYEWGQVRNEHELRLYPLYAINPKLVQYDDNIGFRFAPGGDFQSPLSAAAEQVAAGRQRWGYRREPYQEHIARMHDYYQAKGAQEIAYAAARFERRMGLGGGALDWAIRVAIALHDVGKMDRRWQDWAHEWQRRIGAPVPIDYMVAHTDYDPNNPHHQQVETKLPGSRPPHAAEGAAAVFKVLHHLLGAPRPDDPRFTLMKAIFTAIVRHHAPRADACGSFALHPVAGPVVAQALAGLEQGGTAARLLESSRPAQPLAELLVRPENNDELLAYFLIVRALRLADQGSMDRKE